MNVYDPDDAVVGEAPQWLVSYAEMAAASPVLVVQVHAQLPPGSQILLGHDDRQDCVLERCVVNHAEFGPEDRKDYEVRALRLKDAASVEVFKAILADEVKRGLHSVQDA